ncbi:MAG: hypothetical protein ACXVAY_18025 [Mucilaginibacter sp.]
MEIKVKDPYSGVLLTLTAHAEQYQGLHGFRILRANGSGFFICARSGSWRAVDGHPVEPHLLINIGLALEGYPVEEQQVPYKPQNKSNQ